MGKKIDLLVLKVLLAAAFYFYFRGAFSNRILCFALAILCGFVAARAAKRVTSRLLESGWLKRRRMKKQASGVIMRLACLSEEEALFAIKRLLSAHICDEITLRLLQRHPAARLTEDSLFAAWREARGEDRLLIVTTAHADETLRAMAAGLQAPRVAILDAAQLQQLIAESKETFASEDTQKPLAGSRAARIKALLLNRHNAPRFLSLAICTIGVYILTGNTGYLLTSLGMLALFVLALRAPHHPIKLF